MQALAAKHSIRLCLKHVWSSPEAHAGENMRKINLLRGAMQDHQGIESSSTAAIRKGAREEFRTYAEMLDDDDGFDC